MGHPERKSEGGCDARRLQDLCAFQCDPSVSLTVPLHALDRSRSQATNNKAERGEPITAKRGVDKTNTNQQRVHTIGPQLKAKAGQQAQLRRRPLDPPASDTKQFRTNRSTALRASHRSQQQRADQQTERLIAKEPFQSAQAVRGLAHAHTCNSQCERARAIKKGGAQHTTLRTAHKPHTNTAQPLNTDSHPPVTKTALWAGASVCV
jgi:hypothetical protein